MSNRSNEGKFNFLNSTLMNVFLNDINKEKTFEIFTKSQKTYHAFARLSHIYRYKKAKLQINHDLYLNPITSQKHITILQNGKKYMFTATDLINIINTALPNAPHFFVEPLISKNPYNNIPFDKSTLYNIYFFLRTTNHKMPILIEKYFLSNFDITEFYYENESIIRDIAIENFVFKSECKVLYPSVMNMIHKYDKKNKLYINDEFPKDKLVDIMRPYLHLYYITKYSFMFNKKENAYAELTYKFNKFVKFNPTFGRKNISVNKFTKKTTITYDDKHINFYDIKKTNYNTSHLLLNTENEYNSYETDSDSEDAPVYTINTAIFTRMNSSSYISPFGLDENRTNVQVDLSNNSRITLNYSGWGWDHLVQDNIEIGEINENTMITENNEINDNETTVDSDDEIVVAEDDNESIDEDDYNMD
jgi:hypothetical protein